jgi:CheY-like chemotaxis protein
MMDEIEMWLASQREQRARIPARGGKMDGLSILVVDTDPRYRTLVSRRLEVDGHQTTDVSDGRSAREALRGATWQMLWLHSSLPDASWEEIAREAREQLPNCFIAVLSDSAESPHRPEASCVDAVLPRPWKETELKEVLAGAVAGRSS